MESPIQSPLHPQALYVTLYLQLLFWMSRKLFLISLSSIHWICLWILQEWSVSTCNESHLAILQLKTSPKVQLQVRWVEYRIYDLHTVFFGDLSLNSITQLLPKLIDIIPSSNQLVLSTWALIPCPGVYSMEYKFGRKDPQTVYNQLIRDVGY
jgi:hypothetical protein